MASWRNSGRYGYRLRAPAEVGPAEVGPAEVGPAEVGPAEVGPAEVGPAEVGLVCARFYNSISNALC
jgi:hypothetical protein